MVSPHSNNLRIAGAETGVGAGPGPGPGQRQGPEAGAKAGASLVTCDPHSHAQDPPSWTIFSTALTSCGWTSYTRPANSWRWEHLVGRPHCLLTFPCSLRSSNNPIFTFLFTVLIYSPTFLHLLWSVQLLHSPDWTIFISDIVLFEKFINLSNLQTGFEAYRRSETTPKVWPAEDSSNLGHQAAAQLLGPVTVTAGATPDQSPPPSPYPTLHPLHPTLHPNPNHPWQHHWP